MENWNSFKKRIFINKPKDIVNQTWATKISLETWFLEKADFFNDKISRSPEELLQKDDKFEWKWNNWDFIEKGEIIEANEKDFISFTFGSGGVVNVNLKEFGSGTEVILTQEEIPNDEKSKREIFVGCNSGWTFWLTNLKCYLEYKITLHEKGLKQEETTDLVNS